MNVEAIDAESVGSASFVLWPESCEPAKCALLKGFLLRGIRREGGTQKPVRFSLEGRAVRVRIELQNERKKFEVRREDERDNNDVGDWGGGRKG